MAGRPTKKAAERKEHMVVIRFTSTDKEVLEKAAASDHRTLADWARLQLVKAATEQIKAK